MAKSHSLAQFRQAVAGLRERYSVYQEGEQQWEEPEELAVFNLKFPPWICQVLNFKIITRFGLNHLIVQPYVRPPPEVYLEKMKKIADEEKRERAEQKLQQQQVMQKPSF